MELSFTPQESVFHLSPSQDLGRSEPKKGVKRELKKVVDSATPSTSRSVTPVTPGPEPQHSSPMATPIIAAAGEQLNTDYQIHELPGGDDSSDSSTNILVHHALLAWIQKLESDNLQLKKGMPRREIEDIQHIERLVSLYTGFALCCFECFFRFPRASSRTLKLLGIKRGF